MVLGRSIEPCSLTRWCSGRSLSRALISSSSAHPHRHAGFGMSALDQLVVVRREDQRQPQRNEGLVRRGRSYEGIPVHVELLLQKLSIVDVTDGLAKQLRAVKRTLVPEELAQRRLLIGVTAVGQLQAHSADEPWPRWERQSVVVPGDLGRRRIGRLGNLRGR